MTRLRAFFLSWRGAITAVVLVVEFALVRWAGFDPKGWAPSLGANLATMLLAAFGIEYLIRRERKLQATAYLRMTLLQAGAIICPVMGVIRAPEVYPEVVVNMWIRSWTDLADELHRQAGFVAGELDLETRSMLALLEQRLRGSANVCRGQDLIAGDVTQFGFVLHTYMGYRRISRALYPNAKIDLVASGDLVMKHVEDRLGIKYEELPPMELP